MNQARCAGKYLFVWDKQGSVGTYLEYKGRHVPLAAEIIKVGLGQQTNEGIGEMIRANFVAAQRNGSNLCLDIDACKPAFADFTTEGTFDANIFFNFAHFAQ